MGVPSFFRWLVEKYPNVVVRAREPKRDDHEFENEESSSTAYYDNLYLDMNGIIHPCFHPDDDQDPPVTFQQVFQNIFEYIDWLFDIVRPRKLLFLAIDGVAPRAKMNQQRSRRFRTAKDAQIAESEEERIRKEFERAGKKVLPKQESEVSDSNVITPGTEFMYMLSKALQDYIRQRLNTQPGWSNIKVILSDANSPGEGEHKIMKFIRLQRNLPGYDPNTRHCLYGLDADLIMLALATHEIYFSILREAVLAVENKYSCIQSLQTSLTQCSTTGLLKSLSTEELKNPQLSDLLRKKPYRKPYAFLNVWTLREYLELDLKISDPSLKIDFERVIDDFIFICFFTGNDFLPHMPSLEIREKAIDLLMVVYRDGFKSQGDYLVDTQKLEDKKAGYLNLKRIEKFILSVGKYEEHIFRKRTNIQQLMIKKLMREMANNEDDLEIEQENSVIQAVPIGDLNLDGRRRCCNKTNLENLTSECDSALFGVGNNVDDVVKNTTELKAKLKTVMREKSDIFKQGGLERDKVKFGLEGWKERYYKEKFCAENPKEVASIIKDIVKKYVEGLGWVLQYYFSGVKSWTWFYPYHYAPFASDLHGLAKLNISFEMGTPFKPFDQLMAVLPPRSVCALPKVYWPLIISEQSNLIDMYPTDFDVDVEGKRYLWQGIVKLPFIDENRLLSETKSLEKALEQDEVRRNSKNKDKIFVLKSHELGLQIASLHKGYASLKPETDIRTEIDSRSCGLNGFISPFTEESLSATYNPCLNEMENIVKDNVVCAAYEYPHNHPHIPRLHENVIIPEKTMTEADVVKQPLWHEYEGYRPTDRSRNQDRYRKAIKGSTASDVFTGTISKGAGFGWSAGRGKPSPEAFHSTHVGVGRGYQAANNKKHASVVSSKLETLILDGGRPDMGSSWNRSYEPCRHVQSNEKAHVEFSRNQTSSSYSSVHPMNVGKQYFPSVLGWADGGSNEGLDPRKGYVESSRKTRSAYDNLVDTMNVGKIASQSVSRAWEEGTRTNEGLRRGVRPNRTNPGTGWASEGPYEGLGHGNGVYTSNSHPGWEVPRSNEGFYQGNGFYTSSSSQPGWIDAESNEIHGQANVMSQTSNSGSGWICAASTESVGRGNKFNRTSNLGSSWVGGGSNSGLSRGNGFRPTSSPHPGWADARSYESIRGGDGSYTSNRSSTWKGSSEVLGQGNGPHTSNSGSTLAGPGSSEGWCRGNGCYTMSNSGPTWSGPSSNQSRGRGSGTLYNSTAGPGWGGPGSRESVGRGNGLYRPSNSGSEWANAGSSRHLGRGNQMEARTIAGPSIEGFGRGNQPYNTTSSGRGTWVAKGSSQHLKFDQE